MITPPPTRQGLATVLQAAARSRRRPRELRQGGAPQAVQGPVPHESEAPVNPIVERAPPAPVLPPMPVDRARRLRAYRAAEAAERLLSTSQERRARVGAVLERSDAWLTIPEIGAAAGMHVELVREALDVFFERREVYIEGGYPERFKAVSS